MNYFIGLKPHPRRQSLQWFDSAGGCFSKCVQVRSSQVRSSVVQRGIVLSSAVKNSRSGCIVVRFGGREQLIIFTVEKSRVLFCTVECGSVQFSSVLFSKESPRMVNVSSILMRGAILYMQLSLQQSVVRYCKDVSCNDLWSIVKCSQDFPRWTYFGSIPKVGARFS